MVNNLTDICPHPHCNGRLYIDSDGDRRCFTCGRSPDLLTSLPLGEEPKSSDGRHGAEAIGRSYRRRQSEKTGVKRGDPVMLKEREEGAEVENEPRQKRKYTKRGKPQDAASALETLTEPFEQGHSARCLGCPIKAEYQRLQLLHKGYRLAISDLGGHNGNA